MSDEPIPLYDGEPSGAKIRHETVGSSPSSPPLRCRRSNVRKECDQVSVCFSVQLALGRVDHVECPVFDVSVKGVAIEFDKKVEPGIRGYISFWTLGHRSVRVGGCVRRCKALQDGRFLLGIELDRKLAREERSPAKKRPGREIAMGMRPRKLREMRVPDSVED